MTGNRDRDPDLGRAEPLIQILIVLSLVSYALQTTPDLSKLWQRNLRVFETVTVAIFSIEYVVRVCRSENRIGYIFSFFGIIDLLAIIPFFLSTGLDLRSVRAFRAPAPV